MNISFDGLRKNATQNMNSLYATIQEIISNGNIRDYEAEELTKAFNGAAEYVDVFNCLEDDSGEFEALDISISRLDEDDI